MMIEGDIRKFVAQDSDGNDCGDVTFTHAGSLGIIALYEGDGFDYSNGFPTESFARSSFLSCVASGMRRKAEELNEMADRLEGRTIR